MGTWQVTKSTSAPAPPPVAVFEYHAVATLGLDRSQLASNSEVAAPALANALLRAPEWTRRPWAAALRPTDTNSTTLLALLKLEALFDFASTPLDGDAQTILDAIDTQFPDIATLRLGNQSAGLKRFEVAAFVRLDGRSDWHYDIPEAGDLPPGVSASDDLDDFLRNVVRADLKKQIETLS